MIGEKRLYELGELPRQYEFTDVWKNNTLTQIKLAAYKAMMADGTIHIEKVVCRKNGDTVITYTSTDPHGVLLRKMKDFSDEMEAFMKKHHLAI